MNTGYPIRKSTRLNNFDYSHAGAYFITICTRERKELLAQIMEPSSSFSVGEGLAPPANHRLFQCKGNVFAHLRPCGRIAEEQLLSLEARYPHIVITDYVIMPDHVHAIIILRELPGGPRPFPTLDDVICAYKSLTSRACKQFYGIEKIFQRSYFDHIIRDKDDYELKRNYIYENPTRRYYKTKT